MLQRAYQVHEDVRRVEGLTREQACHEYRQKVSLVARRVADRLPRDAAVQLEDLFGGSHVSMDDLFRSIPSHAPQETRYVTAINRDLGQYRLEDVSAFRSWPVWNWDLIQIWGRTPPGSG